MVSTIMYEGGLLPSGLWEDHPPTLVVHPILKMRQTFPTSDISLALEGGFRHENTDEATAGEDDSGHLWHVQGDLTIPLTGPHSLELKAELRRHELMVTEGDEYWVTMESLGYEMSGLLGATIVHEYSDQTAGADNMIGDWEIPLPHKHYMWGAPVAAHARARGRPDPAPLRRLPARRDQVRGRRVPRVPGLGGGQARGGLQVLIEGEDFA